MDVFHLIQIQIEHRYEIYMETLQKMEIQIVNMKLQGKSLRMMQVSDKLLVNVNVCS